MKNTACRQPLIKIQFLKWKKASTLRNKKWFITKYKSVQTLMVHSQSQKPKSCTDVHISHIKWCIQTHHLIIRQFFPRAAWGWDFGFDTTSGQIASLRIHSHHSSSVRDHNPIITTGHYQTEEATVCCTAKEKRKKTSLWTKKFSAFPLGERLER